MWAPPRVLHPPSHLLIPNLLTYFGSVQKRGVFSAKFPSPSRASTALYRELSRFGTYSKFSLPSRLLYLPVLTTWQQQFSEGLASPLPPQAGTPCCLKDFEAQRERA